MWVDAGWWVTSGVPSVAVTTAHSLLWANWWWKLQSRQPLARSVGPSSVQAVMWWASHQVGRRCRSLPLFWGSRLGEVDRIPLKPSPDASDASRRSPELTIDYSGARAVS